MLALQVEAFALAVRADQLDAGVSTPVSLGCLFVSATLAFAWRALERKRVNASVEPGAADELRPIAQARTI